MWVCTDATVAFMGTVTRIALATTPLVGVAPYEQADYDVIEIITICLDRAKSRAENGTLGLLQTLLARDMDHKERIERMEKDFGLML